MKKFKHFLIAILAIVLGAFCLTGVACDKTPSVSGKTYGFYYMKMAHPNMTIEYTVGQVMAGESFTEEYILMTFDEDGTVTTVTEEGPTEEGTWVQNGKTVTITPNYVEGYSPEELEPYDLTVDGDKITLVQTETDPDDATNIVTITIILKEYNAPATTTSSSNV